MKNKIVNAAAAINVASHNRIGLKGECIVAACKTQIADDLSTGTIDEVNARTTIGPDDAAATKPLNRAVIVDGIFAPVAWSSNQIAALLCP